MRGTDIQEFEEVFYGSVTTTMTAASSWRDNLRSRRMFRMGAMGINAVKAPLMLQILLLLLTCKC